MTATLSPATKMSIELQYQVAQSAFDDHWSVDQNQRNHFGYTDGKIAVMPNGNFILSANQEVVAVAMFAPPMSQDSKWCRQISPWQDPTAGHHTSAFSGRRRLESFWVDSSVNPADVDPDLLAADLVAVVTKHYDAKSDHDFLCARGQGMWRATESTKRIAGFGCSIPEEHRDDFEGYDAIIHRAGGNTFQEGSFGPGGTVVRLNRVAFARDVDGQTVTDLLMPAKTVQHYPMSDGTEAAQARWAPGWNKAARITGIVIRDGIVHHFGYIGRGPEVRYCDPNILAEFGHGIPGQKDTDKGFFGNEGWMAGRWETRLVHYLAVLRGEMRPDEVPTVFIPMDDELGRIAGGRAKLGGAALGLDGSIWITRWTRRTDDPTVRDAIPRSWEPRAELVKLKVTAIGDGDQATPGETPVDATDETPIVIPPDEPADNEPELPEQPAPGGEGPGVPGVEVPGVIDERDSSSAVIDSLQRIETQLHLTLDHVKTLEGRLDAADAHLTETRNVVNGYATSLARAVELSEAIGRRQVDSIARANHVAQAVHTALGEVSTS